MRTSPQLRYPLLAAAALALVGGAFLAGRLLAGSTAVESPGVDRADPGPYGGAVAAVPVAGSSATCQAGGSVDAAGNPTTYEPANAHDADLTTAWRCTGDGTGQRLTLELPEETQVVQVGLVPGYAKTDPANGADRYAENNRITRVRWSFDDGSSHVQSMSADPDDRSMRTLRLPVTTTRSVVLEVLRSAPGSRDTIAVSEVRVGTAAGG